MIKGQGHQGDVFFELIPELPKEAKKRNSNIIAYGEATGHAHRLSCDLGAGELFEDEKGNIYFRVKNTTTLEHNTHPTLTLQPGTYKYTPQGEYTPKGFQRVRD